MRDPFWCWEERCHLFQDIRLVLQKKRGSGALQWNQFSLSRAIYWRGRMQVSSFMDHQSRWWGMLQWMWKYSVSISSLNTKRRFLIFSNLLCMTCQSGKITTIIFQWLAWHRKRSPPLQIWKPFPVFHVNRTVGPMQLNQCPSHSCAMLLVCVSQTQK